jgi:glucose/arabinose dehydrogenase/azurin/lysophospholipase L1-like esterase
MALLGLPKQPENLFMQQRILTAVIALFSVVFLHAQQPAKLELKPGERIALIGNALPDRMQHSGHFETLLHAQFPKHDLVVRNLAAAGDEVMKRSRSENFGSPDDWLTKVKADVIFAYFGFNESFKGYAGIEQFKAELGLFLKETKAKNYSGKGAPRIVLFSPIATEKHRDPNFPDPAANNTNLENYTAAMAEVAKANDVIFVDLFHPSQQLYTAAAQKGQSLTVNGLHLTEDGDKALAPVMFQGVFGQKAPEGNFEKLRAAINEKNAQWHARYRTVDGYNVYGGRSKLSYESPKGGPKISNYDVMQQEMAQRDVLTENRDKRVWAVAKGGDLKVDDSNLPKVTEVKSNKPGANPDGSHKFLGAEEAIGSMKVHSGMKVNLFASEEMFPELVYPVQMNWDTKGRLWVAAWLNYPERKPTSPKGDSLLVFEDTNGDGKADKCTTFLEGLNCPTGFQFYQDGVLVMQAPDLWFVRDTNNDGKADSIERVLMGLDSADSHHTANAICYEPGGAIYLSDGVFHRSQLETATGPVRNNDGAIYRFEPRTGKFETYVSYGFANPHGRVFDYWGNDIITDATGNANYFGPAFSGRIDYPAKHPNMKQFWNRPSRPCPGTGILTSRHFPEEFQGNFLNQNVIGFQGIYRVKVDQEGSGLKGTTMEHLVFSEDPNFRPSDVRVGPDGALYFLDWHVPLIGHMQHHLRDPNRDSTRGRIYRITYEGRPLLKAPKIHGQSIEKLLDLLKEPENGTRELAKVELSKHDSTKVVAAVMKWTASLDKKDPAYEHHMTEALWVHQWHNVVNTDLLKRMLRSPEPNARAAATRVLCYWRDRVSDVLPLLAVQAVDESPRVRLEAVRAASFFEQAQAAEVALASLKQQPTDYYLDYTLGETMKQLEKHWRKTIAEGKPIAADNAQGINYLLKFLNSAEIQKLPRTTGVLEAILTRPGLSDADRALALDELAMQRKTDKATLLLNLLDSNQKDRTASANLARLLAWQLPTELKAQRTRLATLVNSSVPDVRSAAWAALALADGNFDTVWTQASKEPKTLGDLLTGIPRLPDSEFRAKAYPKVLPLLNELPAAWKVDTKKSAQGRYVRIELSGKATLTLAEVQVFSGGENIARKGKATQSSTSHNGDAKRAIDGKTDATYGSGTQTHSRENEDNPWWELDLGSENTVESVTVWNRMENNLGERLNNFTLVVLDGKRQEVFKKAGNATPKPSAKLTVSAPDPTGAIRRAAIQALVSMGTEAQTIFNALAKLITENKDVTAAARGIVVLPRAEWPKQASGTTAKALANWAKGVPAGDRTAQEFIETLQVANDLAGQLPAAEATALRKELRALSVSVFVIRTVVEQMRYDTPRLVVEAGKPFEIIIENPDFMPHNLVVIKPGTREKIGNATATMMPDQLDSQGRPFVPKSGDVLAATKLLEPGTRETLKLTAPTQEGVYEYVCTYPGHWMIMWGQLVVTKDVDGYLQANPQVKLSASADHEGHEHHGQGKK